MPIYEFGYRHWEGTLRPWWLRWFPITRMGVGLALQNRMLRRLMFVAWLPLAYFGAAFFAVGKMTEPGAITTSNFAGPPGARVGAGNAPNPFEAIGSTMLGMSMSRMLREDPSAVRKAAWSWSFYQYMRVSQLLILFLVVSIVGPPLISQDVRAKSFLMYFSKPITRWDYLLGKAGVLLAFAMSVTLGPALVLYAISIGFSPSLAALVDTGLIAVRIFAAFAVTAVPATLLVLFYSSLTREPRYAIFAWVATCILGELFYLALAASPAWSDSSWIFLVSPRQIAATALGAVFDVRGQAQTLSDTPLAMLGGRAYSETTALLALSGISIVSLLGLLRRVTAPLRV